MIHTWLRAYKQLLHIDNANAYRGETVSSPMLRPEMIACSSSSKVAFIYNDTYCSTRTTRQKSLYKCFLVTIPNSCYCELLDLRCSILGCPVGAVLDEEQCDIDMIAL